PLDRVYTLPDVALPLPPQLEAAGYFLAVRFHREHFILDFACPASSGVAPGYVAVSRIPYGLYEDFWKPRNEDAWTIALVCDGDVHAYRGGQWPTWVHHLDLFVDGEHIKPVGSDRWSVSPR